MSVIDTIVKEKKHVKRSDGYHPVSQWTSSDTVEMPNGKTLSENTVELTQAEYDALDDSKLTDGVDYFTTDTQKHIRNGIEYGGGSGDNSRELTYEEYQALSDEEKKNGTVYYVTDLESGGGGGESSNMYYDPTTDCKYLKDENGEWIFVGTAGLKELPLYVNGNQGNFVGYAGGTGGGGTAPILTIGESLKVAGGGYNGSAISDMYDLTRFSKLKFHHNSVTTANLGNKITAFITDKKQTNIVPVTSIILTEGSNKNVSGDIELDITNLSGEYYIGFCIISNYASNVSGTYTVISDLKLS